MQRLAMLLFIVSCCSRDYLDNEALENGYEIRMADKMQGRVCTLNGTDARKTKKIVTIVLLTGFTALAHFVLPTDQHDLHMVHIVLRKLYFLPPVMVAVWFGFRGSLYTTLAVSSLFSLHAFLDWPDLGIVRWF